MEEIRNIKQVSCKKVLEMTVLIYKRVLVINFYVKQTNVSKNELCTKKENIFAIYI
jgi:hypothetical protein